MIPKKIHYIWFGGKPLPDDAKKCIESWKKYCPDYEIIEWNESNYDLEKNEYVKKAYEQKKYAFLADYVRLDVIYEEGGIYLDTDVELVKNLDDLLDNKGYIGMEEVGTINTGQGFGAVKHHPFIKENKEYYENNTFWDEKGNFQKVICVEITTKLLKAHGLKEKNQKQDIAGMKIFPIEYFCPIVMGTNQLKVTKNTYSIHHFAASWKSDNKLIRKLDYYSIPIKKKIKEFLNIEKKEDLKNSKNELIIYNLFFIMTLLKGFGLEGTNLLYLIPYGISCLMIGFKVFSEKYSLKELTLIFIPLIIGIVDLFFGKTTTPLFMAISISCLKGIDIKKVIKIIFWTKLFTLLAMIGLSTIGIIENGYILHSRPIIGETKRYCFGYHHPNVPHMHFFLLTLMYYYLYPLKNKKVFYIATLISNYILYIFTVSRTSFLMTIAFVVVIAVLEYSKKIKKVFLFIAKNSLLIFAILSIVLALNYNHNELVQKMDSFVTGRIYYSSELMRKYAVPLFGNTNYKQTLQIDNSYLYFLYNGGLFIFLYFVTIMTKISHYLYKSNKDKELIVILFISAFAIVENILMNPVMNFTVAFMALYLFKNKSEVVEEC